METNSQTQAANKPVSRVRVGQIEASIWRNEGRNGSYHTVSFERRFKDAGSGDWRSLKSFRASDLLNLAVAGFQAYQQLSELESGDGQ